MFEHWAQHYTAQGRRAFAIPTGASDGIGVWGYFYATEELATDCRRVGISPQHILCATGSGGTQAGLSVGAHYHLPEAAVWA